MRHTTGWRGFWGSHVDLRLCAFDVGLVRVHGCLEMSFIVHFTSPEARARWLGGHEPEGNTLQAGASYSPRPRSCGLSLNYHGYESNRLLSTSSKSSTKLVDGGLCRLPISSHSVDFVCCVFHADSLWSWLGRKTRYDCWLESVVGLGRTLLRSALRV